MAQSACGRAARRSICSAGSIRRTCIAWSDGAGLAFWTFERTTNAYLRPVTSLSSARGFWPRSAPAMHLHSVLWFGLLLGAGRALVRRADRGSLDRRRRVRDVRARQRARRGGRLDREPQRHDRRCVRRGGALVPSALAARSRRALRRARHRERGLQRVLGRALAVGVFGYLLAYALCYERGGLRARVASLAPYTLLLACFIAARRLGHYGVYGLGAYIDPMREPLAFLAKLPVRVIVLLSSQTSRLNADVYSSWRALGVATAVSRRGRARVRRVRVERMAEPCVRGASCASSPPARCSARCRSRPARPATGCSRSSAAA